MPSEPVPVVLDSWCLHIHAWAQSKGWWDDQRNEGDLLMLMVTELAEAYEELRNGHGVTELYFTTDAQGQQKPEGVPVELADTVIRIMDWFGAHQLSLQRFIEIKMAYNETRSYRHGGKLT